MSVFHQIGHNSANLTKDKTLLEEYAGIVCSPLNYNEEQTKIINAELKDKYLKILDPHLYFPRSERGHLHSWSYFPSDFDSADQTNISWWNKLSDLLVESCVKTNCNSICSPNTVPAIFNEDYYKFSTDVGNILYTKAQNADLEFLQTVIIDFNSIGEMDQPEIIASIVSQTEGNSIYLIIKTNTEPRRELTEIASIVGVMKLIRYLSDAGLNIFVAFCSSEFILWNYAGATSFATGKYFNLRRFTSSRFEEPAGSGGGQLPYWFEANLLAYLREGDLIRIKKANLLNPTYLNNPFGKEILELLENQSGKAWLALSWKNYLHKFALIEKDIASNTLSIKNLLIDAEKNWKYLDDNNILMEETRNNGDWIRKWRIAINDFDSSISANS